MRNTMFRIKSNIHKYKNDKDYLIAKKIFNLTEPRNFNIKLKQQLYISKFIILLKLATFSSQTTSSNKKRKKIN